MTQECSRLTFRLAKYSWYLSLLCSGMQSLPAGDLSLASAPSCSALEAVCAAELVPACGCTLAAESVPGMTLSAAGNVLLLTL